jgi:hypothetical protein
LAVLIAVLVSLCGCRNVRLFGQFGSFEYRDTYATLDEGIEAYHQ